MPIQRADEIHTIGFQAFSEYCHESGEFVPRGRLQIQFSEHKAALDEAFQFWIDAIQPDNLQRRSLIEACKAHITE